MKIRKVAFLGANSAMGSQSAALIASFGNIPVFMVARDLKKAKEGIETAVRSVKSNSIRKNLIPATYKQLPKILAEVDWVIEAVSEDFKIKKSINKLISMTKRKNRIISTLTSGLSITKLSEDFDPYDQKRYVGLHFFNPPYKMLLCELIPTVHNDKEMLRELEAYLGRVLLRKVIIVKDTPAFIANRVGFQFMNEALLFAEKYKDKGVVYRCATGRHTGRTLGPLEIDFVGLDVHKAILSNLGLGIGGRTQLENIPYSTE
jgi:3-hydroxyacyl-CoA dehydrogenase